MQRDGLLATWACVLLLTGCATGNRIPGEGRLFETLQGGELILHREITIAPGRLRVSFQDGALAYGYSEFFPHCEIAVAEISETVQHVPAGRYRIDRVIGQTHYVARPGKPVQLAAAGAPPGLLADSTSEWYMFAYHMVLHADALAGGLTLVCGGAYNYPFYARYPTLEEMRGALGAYATLELR